MKSGRNSIPMVVGVMGKRVTEAGTTSAANGDEITVYARNVKLFLLSGFWPAVPLVGVVLRRRW